MAFLLLNSLTVPLENESWEEEPQVIGEGRRAYDGTFRKTERAFKRRWTGRLTLLPVADRIAWKGLIRGLGHHVSFDTDRYSDKGLPGSTGNNSLGNSAPAPKFGAQRLQVNSGFSTSWSTELGSSWTVAVWRWNGATWDHWLKTSAGSQWKNGVVDVTATTWFGVSSGSAFLTGDGANRFYDDLVALPYVVPSDWPPVWGVATSAFSALPKLTAGGDVLEGGAVSVVGELANTKPMSVRLAGVWTPTAATFEFALNEA